jgi:sugar-specific transcriptional regulator TrmB
MLNTLRQIGMEEKHAKIYLACLELGKTSIIEIARKTGIKRTTVYENIDEMISAGYVKITTQGKRNMFVALDPQELKMLMKKREELLDQVMPQLMSINNVNEIKPKIWFYQEKEGILKAYEDSLNYPGSEVFGWASGEVIKMFNIKECENYIARRIRKKIMQTLIMPDDGEANKFTENDSQQLRKTKIISANEYPFRIEINMYANRVAIFSVKDRMAVIIESEVISSAMRMIFRMCWKGIS